MATTTAKAANMRQIATDMRTLLDSTQAAWVHRRLSRGLELVLQRRDREYRLALGRADTWPSLSEIIVCRQAFDVPHGTEPTRVTKERPSKIPNARIPNVQYYVVELLWQEEPQP